MPFGLGSAALAVPLTFTYTSNEVDWSQLQDWEAAYMSAASYNWNDLKPIHYAQVVVEAECEFGAADGAGRAWGAGGPAVALPVTGRDISPL